VGTGLGLSSAIIDPCTGGGLADNSRSKRGSCEKPIGRKDPKPGDMLSRVARTGVGAVRRSASKAVRAVRLVSKASRACSSPQLLPADGRAFPMLAHPPESRDVIAGGGHHGRPRQPAGSSRAGLVAYMLGAVVQHLCLAVL